MRKTIIVGNWKMNGSVSELKTFIEELRGRLSDCVEAGLCVPYTLLATLKKESEGLDFLVGAQNMHFADAGAYTGEISAEMLSELGVGAVILGHSERRSYFAESDEIVNKKLLKAIEKGLLPIVCVGESLEEREEGRAEEVCKNQITKAFYRVNAKDAADVIIAYEPIWAIGTGKTASSQDAEDMAYSIRKQIEELYDEETSQKIRIQYGGSVKASNIADLMKMENVDGALVGGASLKAKDFAELINFAGGK